MTTNPRPRNLTRRQVTISLVAGALAAPGLLRAQPPIVRLIVGYAAGGPTDVVARDFALAFGKELGTQVIVDNRGGVSGSLAGDMVAKAAPDGATLFFAASPTITINPHVQRKMAFSPQKDLQPVAPVLSYANILVVNKDLPFRTAQELIAHARANPGQVSFGSAGAGGSNHLSGELFALQSGAKLTHVPYKGNAPAMQDLIGGQITMMFDIVAGSKPFIDSGRVRALAVTSHDRNPIYPNVPTLRESGLPNYQVIGWFGLYGPSKMAPDVVARLNAATQKALAASDLRARFIAQGYEPWSGPPKVLGDQAARDLAMWATVTKGIEIE